MPRLFAVVGAVGLSLAAVATKAHASEAQAMPTHAAAGDPAPEGRAEPSPAPEPPPPAAVAPVPAAAESKESAAAEAAAALVYSVNRTPERTFDTARAVQVMTREEIRRTGARTLGDLLLEQTGLAMNQITYSSGVPVIRGLLGKQVQILVDGVKINNASWRSFGLPYVDLIDIDMVERIEIVRGVVSVLGTESLGGAINVITRKGPGGTERFGASVSGRFSSGDGAFSTPVSVYGQGDRFRYILGGSYQNTGNLRGGGNVGEQPTAYDDAGGHFRFEYFPSTDKTLFAAYQDLQQSDVLRTDRLADHSSVESKYDPVRLQLLSAGYEDLNNRKLFQYLKLTTFWNRQGLGDYDRRANRANLLLIGDDTDTQLGANLEMRTYLGPHRLIYGVDYTTDAIDSTGTDLDVRTGKATPRRGRYTDGASYRTLGVYLLDHVKASRWFTLSAGARYGRFSASGSEDSTLGKLDIDLQNSDVTGQVSVVFHASSHLNLIGNVMRGFRAPNIDDLANYVALKEGNEIPGSPVSAEHIVTWETGAKYADSRLSASAFYYYSNLDKLIVRGPGTFRGLTFVDFNGNGVRDANEPTVLRRSNRGAARIQGVEVEARYAPRPWLTLSGNSTWIQGDDPTVPEPLTRTPPPFGMAAVRVSRGTGLAPWVEGVYRFDLAQHRLSQSDIADVRIGADGTPAFNVFSLRGGLSVNRHLDLTAVWENIFDEAYEPHASGLYRPGSQAVLTAQLRF